MSEFINNDYPISSGLKLIVRPDLKKNWLLVSTNIPNQPTITIDQYKLISKGVDIRG